MRQEGVNQSLDTSGLPLHLALKVERTAAGIRQFEVAQQLGISESHLSRIESGRKPVTDELAGRIRAILRRTAA